MIVLIVVIGIILFLLTLFAFPQFSPIPYYPSNKKDMKLILEALDIKNNQTIMDLGAGDGIVIFEAAQLAFEKNLNTNFIAVELNPVLVAIMHLRRLVHPNRNNIHILHKNIFNLSISDLGFRISDLTCYLYISPWYIKQVVTNILNQNPKASFVSYFYPIPQLKNKEEKTEGIHSLFKYKGM